MAPSRRGNGPGTLYAQMVAKPIDDILNADAQGTLRSRMLEAFLAVAARDADGLAVSRDALLAADDSGDRLVTDPATTPNRRERLLECFALAVVRDHPGLAVGFADVLAAFRAGSRVAHRYVRGEHVLDASDLPATEPTQETLT